MVCVGSPTVFPSLFYAAKDKGAGTTMTNLSRGELLPVACFRQ